MPHRPSRRMLRAVAQRRRRLRRRARRAFAKPHKTIVVPLLGSAESEHALDLACRLAADRGAHVLLLAPLFVETELPLEAHMHDEERELQAELARTRALAERYGITARGRIVRTRQGQLGSAVADAADEQSATLVVVGAPVERSLRRPFSRDVWSILHDAPCRVMISTGHESTTSARSRRATG